MCGRYVITNPVSKTKKIVKSAIKVNDMQNYNCHPYQELPIIKKYNNGNTLENLKWGILPIWAKNKNFKPFINARLETINEKISFKNLVKRSRCIVIADGYYEWKREINKKIPFYIFRKDFKNLFFAGIYENSEFCIITKNASANLMEVHDRQPVILNEKDINKYLNLQIETSNFLKEYKSPTLNFYQISKDVNKPTNNYNTLIEKI